jgi:hypothetical protein
MDFKLLIILMYFNSVKNSYSYVELISLLRIPYEQLMIKIDYLIAQGYLYKDGEYALIDISSKGSLKLKENSLEKFNILNMYNDNTDSIIEVPNRMEIDEIFIPKDFDKSFKGYYS